MVGVVLVRCIQHNFAGLWKRCDSNWRPWSVVIVGSQNVISSSIAGHVTLFLL